MCHMTRHFYWFFLETFPTDVCFFSSSRCRSNLGCSLDSRTWEHRHRDHSVGKEQFLRKIQGPSSKLTYPLFKALLKMTFLFPRWDMFVPRRVTLYSDIFKVLPWLRRHFQAISMHQVMWFGDRFRLHFQPWNFCIRQFHRSNITGPALGAFFP